MVRQNDNRIIFKAPADLVSEEMQATINALLNAEYYVVITNANKKTRINCQCVELLEDAIEHMAESDEEFKDDLTNIVIDIHRDKAK